MKKYSKGFTLIELLVVIAIIGILSSVVLASLNTARNKGVDSATKSQLASFRSMAEIYYDGKSPQDYSGFCGTPGVLSASSTLANSTGSFACKDDAYGWSASAKLKNLDGTNAYWCSGSSGVTKSLAAAVTATSSCQ